MPDPTMSIHSKEQFDHHQSLVGLNYYKGTRKLYDEQFEKTGSRVKVDAHKIPLPGRKKRHCLKCRKLFISAHVGNRRCAECVARDTFVGVRGC